MIRDHEASMKLNEQQFNRERSALKSSHQLQIDDYNSQISRIAERLFAAEKNNRILIHELEIQKRRLEKVEDDKEAAVNEATVTNPNVLWLIVETDQRNINIKMDERKRVICKRERELDCK